MAVVSNPAHGPISGIFILCGAYRIALNFQPDYIPFYPGMKPILVKNHSPLRRLFPLLRKMRAFSRKFYDRTGERLLIGGGKIPFMDAELEFPEGSGFEYSTPLFWNGPCTYEAETSRLIAALLKRARMFIDVGSNFGMYAVYAGVKHPGILTYAFEPVPRIWSSNVAFHKANGLPAEGVLNMALSDDNKPKTIYIPHQSPGLPDNQTATLRPDSWQADAARVESFQVQCTTLDLFAAEKQVPGLPCLLKIDVENYEAAVLRGARNFLTQRRPWIVCEILPKEEYNRETKTLKNNNRETLQLLGELRYTCFASTSAGLFRMNPADFAHPRDIKDFLLIPEELVPREINYLSLDSQEEIPFHTGSQPA